MIVSYKGRSGSGKTLSMVKDGMAFYQKGYKVYCNFECSFAEKISNEEVLALNKDSDLYNCVIMLDELQSIFDSRKRKESTTFSHFIQQIRKRNIHILGSIRFEYLVDVRIREETDITAEPNFIEFTTKDGVTHYFCEVTYTDRTMTQGEFAFNETENEDAKVKIVFNAEPIFNLYNTEEMIT